MPKKKAKKVPEFRTVQELVEHVERLKKSERDEAAIMREMDRLVRETMPK